MTRAGVLMLLVVLSLPAWADEIEFGPLGIWGPGGELGGAVSFSGAASPGPWLVGGYGSGLRTPAIGLAGGGVLVGVRPSAFLTLAAKAGVGAGFYAGEAGATRQWGAEVTLAGPAHLVLALTWERVWNWTHVASLPPRGLDVWGMGIRLRSIVSPNTD